MLEVPTLAQLRAAARDDVEVEINGALGSRLRESIAFAIAAMGGLYMRFLQRLSLQLFVDTASPSYGLRHASIQGVTPNPATPAGGEVVVSGVIGSSIPALTLLTRDDGAEYLTQGAFVIGGGGQVNVTVSAVVAGSDGNTLTGETLTFTTAPLGVIADSIILGTLGQDGLTGGFDAETAEAVQSRTLRTIRAARRGGSEDDYELWAESITGVAQAWAFDAAYGIGTVLVIISQEWDPTEPGDTPVPTPGLIALVEAYIETQKPAGLYGVYVQGPVLQPLDPYIVLTPDTPEIRTSVEQSLAIALASVQPGSTAYYDDMVRAIDRAAGEQHHRLFVSDGLGGWGPYDTQVGATSLLTPGTPTWTEPP